ncbi:MAG: hypothetical protein LBJ86_05085, partial [Spirochaetaceae bacterium]|nr:hypothetical protein [Spirochaetaceae bacterium]
ALRGKNALEVREVRPEDVPREIRKYYSAPWRIACSILYEDGKRIKTQWVFRDQAQMALFAAAISDNGTGFIEWYDDHGYIVEEQRLNADGSGYFVSYTYKDSFLLKAEGRFVDAVPAPVSGEDDSAETGAAAGIIGEIEESIPGITVPDEAAELVESLLSGSGLDDAPEADVPTRSAADMARYPDGPAPIPETFVAITGRESDTAWTDFYRYTRSKSLRSIRRVFHNPDSAALVRFSRFVENGQSDINFVDTPAPYVSLFLTDAINLAPAKIDYTFDSKRRVVTETYLDAENAVIGELKNTWLDDHLVSVSWTAQQDERRVAYIYDDSGRRVREENYRADVLERAVEFDGSRETEHLYKDGKEMLSIVWVDGRKVSEERPLSVRGPERVPRVTPTRP